MRSYIYQLKLAKHNKIFSYTKTNPAPVWLDYENYGCTFYLVTLSEETDCGRKNGEQNNAYWTSKKNIIWGIRDASRHLTSEIAG